MGFEPSNDERLNRIAMSIADKACREIERKTPKIKSTSVRYKNQYTLEVLIEILQSRV